jgi:hypothetical protein
MGQPCIDSRAWRFGCEAVRSKCASHRLTTDIRVSLGNGRDRNDIRDVETQHEHFDHISQLRHVSIVDNFVMTFEYLFGCWHRNKLSRPFTLSGWTYEVCLNWGKKFAYNRADIGC